jgi:hypothetical protein
LLRCCPPSDFVIACRHATIVKPTVDLYQFPQSSTL